MKAQFLLAFMPNNTKNLKKQVFLRDLKKKRQLIENELYPLLLHHAKHGLNRQDKITYDALLQQWEDINSLIAAKLKPWKGKE